MQTFGLNPTKCQFFNQIDKFICLIDIANNRDDIMAIKSNTNHWRRYRCAYC